MAVAGPIYWVPEGSLAGFVGCVFEVWPAPGARASLEKGGGRSPHIFEGFPGPPRPARPQERTQTNQARLPSGTQIECSCWLVRCSMEFYGRPPQKAPALGPPRSAKRTDAACACGALGATSIGLKPPVEFFGGRLSYNGNMVFLKNRLFDVFQTCWTNCCKKQSQLT